MKRLLAALALAALPACPTVEGEDLPGHLCQVTVETLQDGCSPQRASGDGGVQWLGVRPDGGVSFTIFDQVKFGPLRDGTPLAGVSRDVAPPNDGGFAQFGAGAECRALVSGWELVDGGLTLSQEWPGIDLCVSGPSYLPAKGCVAVRRLVFTPIRECPQRCVVLSNDGASCDC